MTAPDALLPLEGIRVVTLALNLPGPLLGRRLAALGACVTKVEPPSGDPMAAYLPSLYDALLAGQERLTLDLKAPAGRAALEDRLDGADLLVSSSRPAALSRLGLSWPELAGRWPRLSQVALVGQVGAHADRPGHDLTYQARAGTLPADGLPVVLLADQVGAERAVAEALLALRLRDLTGTGVYREVGLADVAHELAEPLRHGLTGPGAPLGGELATYRTYAAAEGEVALAALEPHFAERLCRLLGVDGSSAELAAVFAKETAAHWDSWADEHDLPLAAVASARDPER